MAPRLNVCLSLAYAVAVCKRQMFPRLQSNSKDRSSKKTGTSYREAQNWTKYMVRRTQSYPSGQRLARSKEQAKLWDREDKARHFRSLHQSTRQLSKERQICTNEPWTLDETASHKVLGCMLTFLKRRKTNTKNKLACLATSLNPNSRSHSQAVKIALLTDLIRWAIVADPWFTNVPPNRYLLRRQLSMWNLTSQ